MCRSFFALIKKDSQLQRNTGEQERQEEGECWREAPRHHDTGGCDVNKENDEPRKEMQDNR